MHPVVCVNTPPPVLRSMVKASPITDYGFMASFLFPLVASWQLYPLALSPAPLAFVTLALIFFLFFFLLPVMDSRPS
jgi:hypothetical protein